MGSRCRPHFRAWTPLLDSPTFARNAKLRQQMDALLRFLTIETEPKTREPLSLLLRCRVITLKNPEAPHETQMLIAAGEDGPAISLWDRRQKGRLNFAAERLCGERAADSPAAHPLHVKRSFPRKCDPKCNLGSRGKMELWREESIASPSYVTWGCSGSRRIRSRRSLPGRV